MAPRTAHRQRDSKLKYTGVYVRASTQSFYCELHFLSSGSREKRLKFFRNCPSYDLALLVSDVARFYMRSPGSFTFNLAWSESVIESRCAARSYYESLHTPEEKKRFVKKQTDALISFFTKFNSGICQVSSPERHATDIPLNCPPSYRELEYSDSRTAPNEIVLLKHQALKQKYLEDMIRLRSRMGHCKNTKPMPADEVQKLNQHMLKLGRMISFMEMELPPDLSFEILGSFEKEMHDLLHIVVTANWFLDFDKAAGSAIPPDSARHERHGTDLQLTGLPLQWKPDTDSTILPGEIVSSKDGACSANEERDQHMPGDEAHKDEDMLVDKDEVLFPLDEIPRKELPQEFTFESDPENDKCWMEYFDASPPSSANNEVPPQVLHGPDIQLDGPPSHRKLDTDLPSARGEIVLLQDGACSANEERDQVVWEKHQDIKQMQLDCMSGLRSSMDERRKNTMHMQTSEVQKLNQRMHDLNGMISFMELPREGLPPELSCEDLDAFLTNMLQFYVDTAKWLFGDLPADSCC